VRPIKCLARSDGIYAQAVITSTASDRQVLYFLAAVDLVDAHHRTPDRHERAP
jgi:hypothetical protein